MLDLFTNIAQSAGNGFWLCPGVSGDEQPSETPGFLVFSDLRGNKKSAGLGKVDLS